MCKKSFQICACTPLTQSIDYTPPGRVHIEIKPGGYNQLAGEVKRLLNNLKNETVQYVGENR